MRLIRSKGSNRWAEQQRERAVGRTDDQHHTVRVAVNYATMPGRGERCRHGRLGGRHPIFELTLLELDLGEAG